MKHRVLLLLSLVASPVLAGDPDSIYESLDDVRLGRVFMSPQDRARLDARRTVNNTSQEKLQPADPDTRFGVAKPPKPAAGYIKSGNRKPLVWTDGAFRRAEPSAVEQWSFPGTIRIGSSAVNADDGQSRSRAPDADPDSEEK